MSGDVMYMWSIYRHPQGDRDTYIARQFEISAGAVVAPGWQMMDDLEGLRRTLRGLGLCQIARDDSDEPQIVESWI